MNDNKVKVLVSVFCIALLAFVLGLYLPWWTTALSGFIVSALIYQPPGRSFLSGYLGIFILWGSLAWLTNAFNDSILAARIATILPLGGSVFMLIFVTATTGGLAGGLGSLTASLLRKIGNHGRTA